jgi:hypothetical protein
MPEKIDRKHHDAWGRSGKSNQNRCQQAGMEPGMNATRSPSPHRRAVRSKCSRTHTESRCQGRWDISQRISAARAAPFVRSSCSGIRTQPMTARFAQLVDALNCESRQILHRFLRNCAALELVHRVSITNSCLTELSYKMFVNVGIVRSGPSGVNKNRLPDIVVVFPCGKRVQIIHVLRFSGPSNAQGFGDEGGTALGFVL